MAPPAKKKRKIAAVTVTRRSTRSQRPGLSLEMIAKVATFAQYDDGDLMNICLAVGPKDAAVVRYTCLRKNYRYLQHVLERNVRTDTAKTGADIRAWMAINTDWKDDPVIGCVTREDAEGATSNAVILAATRENGIPTTDELAPIIFNNPAVAIEFGLIDVLKHLVDHVGIDINANTCSSFSSGQPYHLLFHAIMYEESACIEYLMSNQMIDMNSSVVPEETTTLKMFILGSGEMPKELFRAIVCRPTFGVNAPIDVDGRPLSPLTYLCVFSQTDEPMRPKRMEMIQILLDEGADPTLEMGDTPSPLIFASLSAENVEESREVRAGYKEIIRMMERKVESSE